MRFGGRTGNDKRPARSIHSSSLKLQKQAVRNGTMQPPRTVDVDAVRLLSSTFFFLFFSFFMLQIVLFKICAAEQRKIDKYQKKINHNKNTQTKRNVIGIRLQNSSKVQFSAVFLT